VLSASSTAQMQERQTDLPDRYSLGDSWGLGWIRFDWGGARLYGHDGTTIGQNAFLRVLPDAGLAVALLTNGGHPRDLYGDLFRELFAELAGVAMAGQLEPPATPPEVDHSRYVGTYERSSITSEVFERDGRLVLRVIPTGEVAQSTGATVEELELHAVEQGLYATRAPGEETWMAAVFYSLPDGAEYLHYGVRAQPRKA
jgi:hypothetical protein